MDDAKRIMKSSVSRPWMLVCFKHFVMVGGKSYYQWRVCLYVSLTSCCALRL